MASSYTSIIILLLMMRIFTDVLPLTSVLNLALTSLIFIFSIFIVAFKYKRRFSKGVVFYVILFIAAVANGLVFLNNHGYNFFEVFRGVIRYLTVILLFLSLFSIDASFKVVISKIVYFIVFPSMLLIAYGFLVGGYKEYQGQLRFAYPIANPNTLAAFCYVSIFTISLWISNYRSSFVKYIGLLCVIFYLFTIVKTGSLTSLGSVLIFLFLTMYLNFPKKYKLLGLAISSFALLLCLFLLKNTIIERVQGVFFTDMDTLELSEGSSILWRFQAWYYYLSSLSYFNWIFGAGIGVSRALLLPDTFFALKYSFMAPGTHSDYVQVIVDFGVIGLLFFCFSYIRLFSYIKSIGSKSSTLFLSFMLSILFYMLLDNILDSRLFFLISVIFSAYLRAPYERN